MWEFKTRDDVRDERDAARQALDGAMDALSGIRQSHRPSDSDDRLCAEGCNGAWPCTTRLEADHALGNPRPQRR